tara:strand:- start:338 stop:757 length:420 start_codon:yes stop_codon:yes gene_type:complete
MKIVKFIKHPTAGSYAFTFLFIVLQKFKGRYEIIMNIPYFMEEPIYLWHGEEHPPKRYRKIIYVAAIMTVPWIIIGTLFIILFVAMYSFYILFGFHWDNINDNGSFMNSHLEYKLAGLVSLSLTIVGLLTVCKKIMEWL